MDASQRSPSPIPLTPIEPTGARRRSARSVDAAQQASYSTAFSRIEAAVASTCGSQHARNEDAHSDLEAGGHLFVVADGVGGGALAQMASRVLVEELHGTLAEHRLDPERVGHAVLEADRTIARAIAKQTDRPGAATLVLCAPVDLFASRWLVGWVGDCRAYRLALGDETGPSPLTRDDTFRALGEAPPPGGSLDDPARMVGNGATAGASVAIHDLEIGDVLALCSDGVHKHLAPDDWGRLLRQPLSLARRCDALIAAARERGSVDDATVLLLQRTRFGMRRPRWIARIGERSGGPGAGTDRGHDNDRTNGTGTGQGHDSDSDSDSGGRP
ncbi:MAG: PP2C family serine/threonine-protein phosphatase [Caldimonas sp.]